MFRIRKHFAGAITGTLLGVAGFGGGGCDVTGLDSLNSLLSTLDSYDYGYYDTYDSGYSGSDYWNSSSPGYDILDRKSG